jgi:hypothetical protein
LDNEEQCFPRSAAAMNNLKALVKQFALKGIRVNAVGIWLDPPDQLARGAPALRIES